MQGNKRPSVIKVSQENQENLESPDLSRTSSASSIASSRGPQKRNVNNTIIKTNINTKLKLINTSNSKKYKQLSNVLNLKTSKLEGELLLQKITVSYLDKLLEGKNLIYYITYDPNVLQTGEKYKQKGGSFKDLIKNFLSCFKPTRIMAEDILSNVDYVTRFDSIIQSQINLGQRQNQRPNQGPNPRQIQIYGPERPERQLIPGQIQYQVQEDQEDQVATFYQEDNAEAQEANAAAQAQAARATAQAQAAKAAAQAVRAAAQAQTARTQAQAKEETILNEYTDLLKVKFDNVVQIKILEKYIESFDELFTEASHRAFIIDIDHVSEEINPVIEIMQDRYRDAILYSIRKMTKAANLPPLLIDTLRELINKKFLYKDFVKDSKLTLNMDTNIFADKDTAKQIYLLCDFIQGKIKQKFTVPELDEIFKETTLSARITDPNKFYIELTFYLAGFDNILEIKGIKYTYEVNPELVVKIFTDKMKLRYSEKHITFTSNNFNMYKQKMFIPEKIIKTSVQNEKENETNFIEAFNFIKEELYKNIVKLKELQINDLSIKKDATEEYNTLLKLYKRKLLKYYMTDYEADEDDNNTINNLDKEIKTTEKSPNNPHIFRIYANLKLNNYGTSRINEILKDEDNQIILLYYILQRDIEKNNE